MRIECDAKGIVFVVQTESGLLRLRTASFEDIELTTYDPKRQRRDHLRRSAKAREYG